MLVGRIEGAAGGSQRYLKDVGEWPHAALDLRQWGAGTAVGVSRNFDGNRWSGL